MKIEAKNLCPSTTTNASANVQTFLSQVNKIEYFIYSVEKTTINLSALQRCNTEQMRRLDPSVKLTDRSFSGCLFSFWSINDSTRGSRKHSEKKPFKPIHTQTQNFSSAILPAPTLWPGSYNQFLRQIEVENKSVKLN